MTILHHGADYWNNFGSGKTSWRPLEQSATTEVLIIGGGLTGFITAYMLQELNIDFILVDAHKIAEGSTLASTGLLQYSNDVMLFELQQKIGIDAANYYYRSCYDALLQLKSIVDELQEHAGEIQFAMRSSMQYSTTKEDISKLKQEFEALSSIGLPCELWSSSQIQEKFPFSKHNALITHHDAEFNPYLFVLRIAQYLDKRGAKLFEHSSVSSCEKQSDGSYRAAVNGYNINAKFVVHCVGYQFEQLGQKQLQPLPGRSYVIVTDPLPSMPSWNDRMLIWETKRPYLYARTTADNRIMIGGLDESVSSVNDCPASIEAHSSKLHLKLLELFPGLQTKVAYQWNATFITTNDGLPYVGAHAHEPNRLCILGYGGNGAIASILGAQLVAEHINGTTRLSRLADILSLTRS